MKCYFSPSKYAFWLQCYLEKILLVINIKVILPHCKLVLYPRMVSGLSLKTSIILFNKICVFIDNLVCFLLCLCCVFLLAFSTSSFLFKETLHIKVVILLILVNIIFPISERFLSANCLLFWHQGRREGLCSLWKEEHMKLGQSDRILIYFQCFKAPEWGEVHCMCKQKK